MLRCDQRYDDMEPSACLLRRNLFSVGGFSCLVNWKEFVSFKSRSNGGVYYKHSDEVEGLDWKVHFSVL